MPYAVAPLSASVSSFSAGAGTGLTPNTATTGNVVLGGTLATTNGGTGVVSPTAGSVLVGNGASAVSLVAASTSGNVLTSNGTTWTSTARPAIVPRVQIFTASGTFTVPANVTAIKVTVTAGGNTGIYGNGGGGTSLKWISGLVPAATIAVTVGAASGSSSFAAYCSATPGSLVGGTGVGGDINLVGGTSTAIGFSCGKCSGGGIVDGGSFLGGAAALYGGGGRGGAVIVEWFTYG